MSKDLVIRKMNKNDTGEMLKMMQIFYASPAVLCKVNDEILMRDIKACIVNNPLVKGYVFEVNGKIAGYSILAKSFSTEAGGTALWIEDLYIKPEYRKNKIGTKFFEFVEKKFKSKISRLRLEVEKENIGAINLYKKCGYKELPYVQMYTDIN